MSYYNVLAIFNEIQLAEIESVITLTHLGLMNECESNQLVKAVEDYQYLVENAQTTRGLTQQIILFLLDEASTTPEGIEFFLSKLEVWLVIVENKKEQRIYAEVLNKYRDCFNDTEVLALRTSLLDILHELDDIRAERKKQKRFTQWQSQDMTWTEPPMQHHPEFAEYELQMRKYGQSFESPDSLFNSVPDIRHCVSEEQPSFYDQFIENYSIPKGWVTPVLYQDNK